MPLHDYWCPTCGLLTPNIYRPVQERATANPPLHCGRSMSWVAAAPALHYGDVKGAAFKSFDTTDGRGNPVHIDSLQKLRQVERESEQMARDGVGQPMVWRRYAQNASNADQPTLSRDYSGGEQPTPEGAHKFGSTLQKSVEAPDHSFGPGVTEATASALPMSGKE